MRVFKVVLEIEKHEFEGCELERKHNDLMIATLDICDKTTFANIVKFINHVKVIWKEAMKVSEEGAFINLEITDSVYEYSPAFVQKSFDRWVFEGYNSDKEGIYLRPDEQYTPCNRDMYLTEDLLKDLAFTLR